MTRYTPRVKPSLRDTVARNRAVMDSLCDSAGKPRMPQAQVEADFAARPKRTQLRKPSALQPSEHQIQRSVIFWWRHACGTYGLPKFALFSIPNGGMRDPITASRLQAEGLRAGIPDLMLARPVAEWAGLFLEMKAAKGRTSEEQDEVMGYLQRAGYRCAVCWSAEEAIQHITQYLGGTRSAA